MSDNKLSTTPADMHSRVQSLEKKINLLEKRLDEAGIFEVQEDNESENNKSGPAKKIIIGVLGVLSGTLLPVVFLIRKFKNK